ncbi:hypothetical protein LXA43DRAFT_993573 [Ganoderma leucocontextum]|nr:hypothetical protein LXA43DRAFT_993573 [Ganoderma leucocontextum]
MLSLAGAFRTAARRQTCTACAATTRSVSHDSSTIRDLSDILHDAAKVHEASQAGAVGEDDGIIDSVPVPVTASKGFPILRGFQAYQFVQPKQFSRAEYNKLRSYTRRPALGPDAQASRHLDPLHQLGIDPRKESLNSSLLSRFVTSMGKIKKRSETNLTWMNQRRVGKAIRRAKMMGIIPVLSKRHLHDSNDLGA